MYPESIYAAGRDLKDYVTYASLNPEDREHPLAIKAFEEGVPRKNCGTPTNDVLTRVRKVLQMMAEVWITFERLNVSSTSFYHLVWAIANLRFL